MTEFTPLSALLGGALIGLAAAWLLWMNGRIAGISGIVAGLLQPRSGEFAWRLAFVAGLVGAGIVSAQLLPERVAYNIDRSTLALVGAGLLVGFGTRLGSGCTSGHGVCGLSRLSRRSLASVFTFMFTGAVTVWLTRSILGGV